MAVLRRAWDSDACLAFLKDEPGRGEACARVLDAAQKGHVEIILSAVVLAEVLWVAGKAALPETSRAKVRAFFKHEYFTIVDTTRFIAEAAQELVWKYRVQPKDAIHVASAQFAKVEELNTFDGGLLALDGKIGDYPQLRIRKPDWEKQEELFEGRALPAPTVTIEEDGQATTKSLPMLPAPRAAPTDGAAQPSDGAPATAPGAADRSAESSGPGVQPQPST